MREKIGKALSDKTVIRFLLVGGACTLLDFCIYMAVFPAAGAVTGKGLSMSCSMVVNYFLNKFWSFSAGRRRAGREAVRYLLAQMANLLVNVSVNAFVLRMTGMKIVAYVSATGIAMVVNYILQRFWVFHYKNHEDEIGDI